MSTTLVPPLLPPLYVPPSAPLLPPLGPARIRLRRPPVVAATESLPPAEQYAASPLAGLVAHFTALVAVPGTPASYIDANNVKVGTDGQQTAAWSGRAYFVTVKATMLVIDCDDGALLPVLDELAAQLRAERLEPVRVGSGGADRQHLFGLIDDPRTMRRYVARIRGLGYGPRLEVRPTIRPPLSPHRRGKPVRLLSPEDPAEAIAALTPRRPPQLASERMAFLEAGAPKGRRSTQLVSFCLAALNAGWSYGHVYWALMDPHSRGGEKLREQPDPDAYLERVWAKVEQYAAEHAPVGNRDEALAQIARLRARSETWAWPTRSGEMYHRVLAAYLTIAERSGKLVFAAGIRAVADEAGVAIGGAVKATKWLRDAGWLRLHQGYKRGTAEATLWRVTFPTVAQLMAEQVRRLTLQGLSVNTLTRVVRLETVRGRPQRDAQENETESVPGEPQDLRSSGEFGETESVRGTAAGGAKWPRRLLRRADQPRDPAAPRLRVDGLATESVHGRPQGEIAQAPTESVHGRPQTHDLWRTGGLGARAGQLYALLQSTTTISAKELALRIGCRPQAVRRQLVRKLGRYGLAVQDVQGIGWLRGDADMDAVAAELGVAGKGAAQREEHMIQRTQFKKRLDEGGLRRRTDGR